MKAIQRSVKLFTWVVLAVAAVSLSAIASAQDKTAHEVANTVKDQMIDLINNQEKYAQEGEGKYYQAVVAVFEPVVDFEFIARGVMAKHGEAANDEQRQRFAEVLKESLMSTVSTYTQGVGGSGDFAINMVPPKEGDADKKRVSVGMEVTTGDAVNRLAFNMQYRNEQWKIANMTLNGINLGVTFRAQFDQAVKKNDGDINAAIAGWSS